MQDQHMLAIEEAEQQSIQAVVTNQGTLWLVVAIKSHEIHRLNRAIVCDELEWTVRRITDRDRRPTSKIHAPDIRRLGDDRVAIVKRREQEVSTVVEMDFRSPGAVHRIGPDAIGNLEDDVRPVPSGEVPALVA